MAFNPFNTFRKHKKKAFAVLTIVCMFVFILSSGMGGKSDLLNMTFFGSGRRSPQVATIDGKKIDALDLRMVQDHRKIANEFMRSLVMAAGEQLSISIQARLKDMDPFARQEITQVLQIRNALFSRQLSSPEEARFFISMMQQGIQTVERTSKTLEDSKKTEDADLLRRLKQMLQNDLLIISREAYFGGGWRTGDELLNFMLWKWVADQREITLTMEAVNDLIRQDTYNVSVDEVREKIAKELLGRWKIGANQFQEMLRDEYRVRVAQTAVLGAAPGFTEASPGYVTPHEFYKYFRDNRTTIRASLLQIDAETFLDKVTDKPSEAELRDLFTKHQREEAQPFLESPGFKEGKKVKVEWLGTKAENPLVKKLALEEAKKDSDRAEAIKKSLFAPSPGNLAGTFGRLGALAMLDDRNLMEKRIDKAYEEYLRKARMELREVSWVHSSLLLFGVHDRSMLQPQVIAAGVADLLAGAVTGKSALSFPVAWGSRGVMEEIKERIRFGLMPMSLSGPYARNMFGVNEGMVPQPPSREAMASILREEVTDPIVKDFIRTETTKFQEEMTKKAKDIKKPEVKKEIQSLVDAFAKKFGFTRGVSAGFRDRYSLVDDPGLKPLKDAYLKEERNKTDPKGSFFGTTFFDDSASTFTAGAAYRPVWFEGKDPSFAMGFTKPDDESFLVWKTEEEAPRVRKFEEAKADVERAWKLAKARELAKKAAEEMQKEVRDKAIRTPAALKDYAAQKKVELVEVGPLSKLVENPPTQPRQPSQYATASVPAEKVNYPTRDFAEKLVDLRDKPIGETIVLNNAPRNLFYVGVLTDRTEPSDFAFQQSYSRANGDGLLGGGDPLLKIFANRRRKKLEDETIEQLKADARLTTVPEELKRFSGKDSGGSGSGGGEPDEG